jgi:type II secretory pathway component PulJ
MTSPIRSQIRASRGFSVLELMVALGLASVVMAVLVAFFMNLARSSTTQNAAAAAQHSARAGIEYMVHELLQAGLDPLKTAGAGIEEISAAGSKLRFTADRCNLPVGGPGCTDPAPDGTLDDQSERVTYVYNSAGQVLSRCLYEDASTFGTGSSSGICQPVLENVTPNPEGTPLFLFLDDADNPITNNNDRGLVRTVVITLTVAEPAGRDKKVARTYSSRVRLRNIGL